MAATLRLLPVEERTHMQDINTFALPHPPHPLQAHPISRESLKPLTVDTQAMGVDIVDTCKPQDLFLHSILDHGHDSGNHAQNWEKIQDHANTLPGSKGQEFLHDILKQIFPENFTELSTRGEEYTPPLTSGPSPSSPSTPKTPKFGFRKLLSIGDFTKLLNKKYQENPEKIQPIDNSLVMPFVNEVRSLPLHQRIDYGLKLTEKSLTEEAAVFFAQNKVKELCGPITSESPILDFYPRVDALNSLKIFLEKHSQQSPLFANKQNVQDALLSQNPRLAVDLHRLIERVNDTTKIGQKRQAYYPWSSDLICPDENSHGKFDPTNVV